jgi:hypothetical protein
VHEAKHVAAGLDLWYQVTCSDEAAASGQTWSKLEAFLAKDDAIHEGVAYVEPALAVKLSQAVPWPSPRPTTPTYAPTTPAPTTPAPTTSRPTTLTGVPNDPLFSSQSHYSSIALEAAWEITTGSPSAVVQVLDTGLDMAHEDLQNNIWQNPGETDCSNGLDDDGNGFVDDCHGYNHADGTGTDLLGDGSHGSHCAGTIAADSNNGIGVAGVAGGDGTPGSGASIMISVGFGSTFTGGFAEALVYGADNGAQVSSNSSGRCGNPISRRAASIRWRGG